MSQLQAAQGSASSMQKQPKKKGALSIISLILDLILTLALLIMLVSSFWVQLVWVDGTSMENTLHDGEILLVARKGEYSRGDVVICRYPRRTEKTFQLSAALALTKHTVFVKRLVALPGDSVEIRQGQLYVNDEPVSNPAQMGSVPRDFARRELGRDEYFVIGDNRRSSHDSRAADVGPISGSMLQGHVKKVIWPLSRIRNVE